MFDFKAMVKQVAAAGAVGFGAAITAALLGDVSGALAAAHSGVGAAVGVGLGIAGNIIAQLVGRVRNLVAVGYEDLDAHLATIEAEAKAARKSIG